MRKYLIYLLIPLFVGSCNDGDIILTSFDFGNASLENCGGPGAYVFFKINNQAAESISLQLGTSDELFMSSETRTVTLDGSSNFANYRQFSEAISSSYFCSNIPPTSPTVTNEYIGESGVATLVTTTVLDDMDGIETADEIDMDTDIDGIPDYYDFDDDGDNVPTIAELGDDPENPRDTDGDTIPDYLDTDDDNDGVLTRYEDSNMDLDPTNDVTDPNVGPDYLNPAVSNKTIIDEYRPHTYNLKSDISLSISNLVLINENEQITRESLDMGEIIDIVNTQVVVTPEF